MHFFLCYEYLTSPIGHISRNYMISLKQTCFVFDIHDLCVINDKYVDNGRVGIFQNFLMLYINFIEYMSRLNMYIFVLRLLSVETNHVSGHFLIYNVFSLKQACLITNDICIEMFRVSIILSEFILYFRCLV